MDDYKSLKGFDIKVKIMENSISRKGHKEEWLALQSLKMENGLSHLRVCYKLQD